jgi:RNA polymerase sigma factor (sigma-70 family)
MAERPAEHREDDKQPEQAEQSPLSRALHGTSLLLKLNDDERQALASHFLPNQPEVPWQQRRLVHRRVEELFKNYFAVHKNALTLAPWNDVQAEQQKQFRFQRQVVGRLIGDPANALQPMRLDDLLQAHPDLRPQIIDAAAAGFIGVLEYYARLHHIEITRLVGKTGLDTIVRLQEEAPQSEEVVEVEVEDDEALEEDDELAPAWEGVDVTIPKHREFRISERGVKIRWGAVNALSKEFGQLAEDESQWWVPSLLRIPFKNEDPESAYLGVLDHRYLANDEVLLLYERMQDGREALEELITRGETTEKSEDLYTQILQMLAVLGYRARHVLIAHNLRLVRGIVRRRAWTGEMDEFVQGGNLGLVNAADNYDPYHAEDQPAEEQTLGHFPTLATWHISGKVRAEVRRQAKAAHVRTWPGKDVIGSINKEDRELLFRSYQEARRIDPDVTYVEVGKWLGFPEIKVEHLIENKTISRLVYIDEHAVDPQDPQYSAILRATSDPSAASEVEVIETGAARRVFWEAVRSRVARREYQVLVMRYAYDLTQIEIAAQVGVTRQRIQQLEKRALLKLKDSMIGFGDEEREARKPAPLLAEGPAYLLGQLGLDPYAGTPASRREYVAELINRSGLKGRALDVALVRYGLGDDEGTTKSQSKVQAILGVSRGVVTRASERILRTLRDLLRADEAE